MALCNSRPQSTSIDYLKQSALAYLCLLSLNLLLAVSIQASELGRQAYVITLHNNSPESLLPVIKPLLQEGDAATGFGNEIIVTTNPARIEKIRDVVRHIDKPLQNLIIHVTNNDSGETLDRARGFSGNIKKDKVIVGLGNPVTVNEGVTVGHKDLSYSMLNQQRSHNTQRQQQVRAVEGHPAFIYTGQSITLTGRNDEGPYTVEADALQGVYVTARLLGNDRVELKISTSNDSLVGNTDEQILIDTQQLSTVVTAPLGEWIDLGGLTLSSDSRSNSDVKKFTTEAGSLGNIAVKITPADMGVQF